MGMNLGSGNVYGGVGLKVRFWESLGVAGV